MGYVYLILSDDSGYYKIGKTKNCPNKRIKTLSTGTPDELILISHFKTDNMSKLESWMHRKYDSVRVEREWFSLTEKEVKEFYRDCQKADDTIKVLLRDNPFFN